jgi:hypothetical protein
MTKPLRPGSRSTKIVSRQDVATCLTCRKGWSARNAMAVGAIHARSHGHRVKALIRTTVIYDGTSDGRVE